VIPVWAGPRYAWASFGRPTLAAARSAVVSIVPALLHTVSPPG
jgi:hypothetical protein